MRAVVQRVKSASVEVEQQVVGAIGPGLLVYLAVAADDSEVDMEYMVRKIAGLRIFADDEGKMSRSVRDTGGACLVISQFTLFGDVRNGNRPAFVGAASLELAEQAYDKVVIGLRSSVGTVETGKFRATMLVTSVVDGPVTIQIDSKKIY